MKKLFCLFILLAFAAASGQASAGVSVDYDTEKDFTAYRTYAWMPGTAAQNPLIDKRIRKAIDAQLEAKGLSPVDGDADLYVLYHVALNEAKRINVDDFGYRGRWGGAGRTTVDVYDVKIGTLVVDLVDAGSEDLVWRGLAEKEVSANPTPEKAEKKINKIVGKMFKKYPPQ